MHYMRTYSAYDLIEVGIYVLERTMQTFGKRIEFIRIESLGYVKLTMHIHRYLSNKKETWMEFFYFLSLFNFVFFFALSGSLSLRL